MHHTVNQFRTEVVVLIVLWLLRDIGEIRGSFIRILLVISVIVIAYRLLTDRNIISDK